MTGAAPTFHAQIAANRRASWGLMAVVTLLLVALGGTVGYALGFDLAGIPAALTLSLFLGLGSYFGGDGMVLRASGAHELNLAQPPEAYRQLLNVVEEMRLASGLPMPRVYVINDTAPNAFATGRDPKHASIAVTTGLLEKLDREELQGVIGHEMSHVRNLDIRFMLLIGVMVGAIALIADAFLNIARFGGLGRGDGDSDSDGGGKGAAILFLVVIVAFILALVAPLISRLVLLAASRRREGLADVSAVELTRNPIGLASALRRIADDPEVLEVANKATQHLYIVNPIKAAEERSRSMWDTHPPIAERIRVLEQLAGASAAPSATTIG